MKKEKKILLRLDLELYNNFKTLCEINYTTMSNEIRQFILSKLKEKAL